MMGTIYKRSFTNVQMLNIAPARFARLFLICASIGIVICSFLSYKAIKSFHEVGMAEDMAHAFEDYESMLVYFLNLGFIVLMVISNLHSQVSKKISWYFYLLTFLIYATFAVLDNFFLEDAFFHFKKINLLWKGEFSLAEVGGYISLFIAAGLCVFNALMTRWGLKK
jgi:phosphate starvation-inducible membrane PsiE